MTSLKSHMRLNYVGKQFQCDVCNKMFNNYSVMVVHKRNHFRKRLYKCLECGDEFCSTSSLKSHYKLHKQQSLYEHEKDEFSTFLSSYQEYDINAVYNKHEWGRYEQSYTGKFFMIVKTVFLLVLKSQEKKIY